CQEIAMRLHSSFFHRGVGGLASGARLAALGTDSIMSEETRESSRGPQEDTAPRSRQVLVTCQAVPASCSTRRGVPEVILEADGEMVALLPLTSAIAPDGTEGVVLCSKDRAPLVATIPSPSAPHDMTPPTFAAQETSWRPRTRLTAPTCAAVVSVRSASSERFVPDSMAPPGGPARHATERLVTQQLLSLLLQPEGSRVSAGTPLAASGAYIFQGDTDGAVHAFPLCPPPPELHSRGYLGIGGAPWLVFDIGQPVLAVLLASRNGEPAADTLIVVGHQGRLVVASQSTAEGSASELQLEDYALRSPVHSACLKVIPLLQDILDT
ncbi:hypothetical protein CYMTET_52551, partial [Cymbomonas tetramitiformis]